MRRPLASFLLVVVVSVPCLAETELAALLEPIRERHGVPALAGAIVVGPRVTAIGATGLRRKKEEWEVTTTDLWHLGSCGKAMTATVIARLVEQGRLRWDRPLSEALPALALTMQPAYRDVSLPMLLQHRAGLPSDLEKLSIWSWLWSHHAPPADERGALVKFLLDRKPEVTPGTRTLYANGGYVIAGFVAERATGGVWEELIQTELFAPLGMHSASFGAPGAEKGIDAPWGHQARSAGGAAVPPGPSADNPPAISPAGTVHASLSDWARFVSLHLGADASEPPLLSAETLERLHTPPEGETYAYGWITAERDWAGGTALTHLGSNTMWTAVAWLAPARDFAVLVVTNQGGDEAAKAVDDAAGALIRQHLASDALTSERSG